MGFDQPNFAENFWPGFWGNCLADIIVAIVIASILARIGIAFRQPNAILRIDSEEIDPESGWITLMLKIDNIGKLSFGPRELSYHIWIMPTLEVDWESIEVAKFVDYGQPADQAAFLDSPLKWHHMQGHLDAHLFPAMDFDILHVRLRPRESGAHEIRWHFDSVHGVLPQRPFFDKMRKGLLRFLGRGNSAQQYYGKDIFRTLQVSRFTRITPPAPESTSDPS